jgi:UDP-glucuronate 4-epimerase
VRVLVTGACGFIGSHVTEALLRRGDTVVGIDDFNDFYDPRIKEGHREILERSPGFSLVRGSVLDEAALALALGADPGGAGGGGVDAVIHLAAWAGVRPSIERPQLYARENVSGTTAVLEAIRRLPPRAEGPPRLVFASSSSVYGGNEKVPFHEDDPVDHPVSPYAATKKAGELLCWTFHHLHRLPVTCLRFFTVYGPRQRPEMAIHKFAQLLADGRPIPRYGDGKSARDYTFIDDIVQGVLAAVDRCGQFGGGFRIYNLGNSRTVSLDELIEKLAAALRVAPRIEPLPDQPGDVPLTCADVSRARAELDYRPDFPLERGLARFAAWFQARPHP